MIREEMLERMPAAEYVHWVAYFGLEPFGDRLVASTLYNTNRSEKAPFLLPFDYMTALKEKQPEHIQTPREIRAVFESAEPKPRKRRPRK